MTSQATKNKYCSNSCQQEVFYRDVTLPRILKGDVTPQGLKTAVLKYLTDRDGYKCAQCGLSEWYGKQMILDIDHIDGDNKNNLPSNWRFLCPNCHRLTPTWGNKRRN